MYKNFGREFIFNIALINLLWTDMLSVVTFISFPDPPLYLSKHNGTIHINVEICLQ